MNRFLQNETAGVSCWSSQKLVAGVSVQAQEKAAGHSAESDQPLTLIQLMGRSVAVIFNGTPSATALRYPMPEGMAAGAYTLTCETPTGITKIPFVVTR